MANQVKELEDRFEILKEVHTKPRDSWSQKTLNYGVRFVEH